MDGDRDWEVLGLEKVLRYLCANAKAFGEMLLGIVRRFAILRLILYSDGLTPGNALGHDNKRKSVIWYASFLEFGELLCHEECWVSLACARQSWVRKAPAGASGLTCRLLRNLFLDQCRGEGFPLTAPHYTTHCTPQ